MKKKIQLAFNILLLLTIISVILFLLRDSLDEIVNEIFVTPFSVVLSVFFLGVISLLAEGAAIKRIATTVKVPFSFLDGIFASCYMTFYRIVTFGSGALVAEVYYYRKKGARISQGTGITVLRMLIYKSALSVIAVLGLLFYGRSLTALSGVNVSLVVIGLIFTVVVVVGMIIVTSSFNLQILFVNVANKLFKKEKLRQLVDKINLQIYALREAVKYVLRDPSALASILCWNIVKLFCWYTIPYLVLTSRHPDLPFNQLFFFTSFVVILAGVIPAPGGLGSFEFVYLLLFSPIVGKVDATSSMLLYRFVTYLLPFLIGFIYVFSTKQHQIKGEIRDLRGNKNH